MRPSHLPRSATSPDLSSPPFDPTTNEAHENTLNRDGAISRVDRYSRILPAAPTNPPPPPPTIASSSRPSGLRHVILASEIKATMQNTMDSSSSTSFLTPTTSHPLETSRKHRFRLNTARQGMQKAFSSMRTHASPSNIGGLSLRKKSPGSGSGSGVSAKVMLRDSVDSAASSGSVDKILIGAPTGMIKKTPEEIQEILRQLGGNGKDFRSSDGSCGSFDEHGGAGRNVGIVGRGNRIGEEGRKIRLQKGKRSARAYSTTSQSTSNSRSTFLSNSILPYPKISTSISTSRSTHTPHDQPKLTAKQRGKLPARSPSPSPSPQISLPIPSLELEQEKKPLGWYTTATLDEIRTTLPSIKKEDLIPDEEIPEFVEGLMRDLEVLKWTAAGVRKKSAVLGLEPAETQDMIEKTQQITTGDDRYKIEEDFAAEEEFDEDARQITREEILRGEFKFTQVEILEREGMM
ncbi:40484da4-122a-4d89-a0ba-80abcf41db96 [Sclerotinia trifoliorum]|uniref:40484da4-122a-4d89-a0ba-80abcf41db96 n=1 Tax=Sclerotinia trifoliorum TaxID=28548 RepID=A0A8H2ZME4_9HELO|nr:40484da4-122a-4d89-a0ba-80abcf41db96 [Sclerotinia trifoliorum]